jgi:hypothetical protein
LRATNLDRQSRRREKKKIVAGFRDRAKSATPSARAREWAIAGAAIVLAALLFFAGRGRTPAVGSRVEFPVTVIPPDAANLGCASSEEFSGERCAFESDSQPSQTGHAVDRPLRPYVTTYSQVVLLAGVFEDAQVAAWLERERSRGADDRVTLTCPSIFLGKAGTVGVRWRAQNAFSQEHDVPIGRVETCRVSQ